MIRPITLLCWILALGAGLYLYRAKHEVELIDRRIEQIAKETSDLRVQSRRFLDDWIRLGQPEQLHKYSDQYLGLKTIAPTQFVRLSDLPARLPAPRADPVEEPAVAMDPGAASEVETAALEEAEADDLPIPPIPPLSPNPQATAILAAANPPAVPLQARPVTPRPAVPANSPNSAAPQAAPQAEPEAARSRAGVELRFEEPHSAPARPAPVRTAEPRLPASTPTAAPVPVARAIPFAAPGVIQAHELPPPHAQQAFRPMETRGPDPSANVGQRMPLQAAEPRAVASQPVRQVAPQMQAATPAMGGSMLGMSRGSVPPPVPVNAAWNNPR